MKTLVRHSPNLAVARILLLSCLLIALAIANGVAAQQTEGRIDSDPASSQDPNTVIIQPGASAGQPAVSIVQLAIDKNRVRPGETVTFTLAPACIILDPHYSVTIDFGDQTSAVVSQVQIVHLYQRAGHYEPRVSVVLGQRVSGDYEDNSLTQSSLTPSRVSLSAAPMPAVTGRPVIFSAQITSTFPNIRYRFVFGDGSPASGWQESSQTAHKYSAPGTYRVFAEAARLENGMPIAITTSSSKEISVRRPAAAGASALTSSATPSSSATSNRDAGSSSIASADATTQTSGTVPSPGVSTQTGKSTSSGYNVASPGPTNVAPPGLAGLMDDWWKYLLIAVLLLLAGYQFFNLVAIPRAARS